MRMILPLMLLCLLLSSCSTSSKGDASSNDLEQSTKKAPGLLIEREPTTIYKADESYYDKVSILLSDDKSRIVSYPHPTDVFYKGKLALPTKLKKGYYLDNRGVNGNTAFLNISFAKYAQLKSVPSLAKFNEMIIDKDPIIELYRCGDRTLLKNEVEELNHMIEKNLLEDQCQRIK